MNPFITYLCQPPLEGFRFGKENGLDDPKNSLCIGCIGLVSFAGYMAWKEELIKNSSIGKVLKGGITAFAILRNYEKLWKIDERILDEALKDNPHTFQIIGINRN